MELCNNIQEVTSSPEAMRYLTTLQRNCRFSEAPLDEILSNSEVLRRAVKALFSIDPTCETETFRQKLNHVSGLVESEPQKPARPETVIGEVGNQSKTLAIQLTTSEGIEHGWTLSHFDLVTAAANAYCTRESHAIPSFDLQQAALTGGNNIVTPQSNPLLFMHILTQTERSPDLGPRMAQQVMRQGQVSIGFDFYKEYIEALQKTARFVDQNPDKYLDALIDITSGLNYFYQTRQNDHYPNAVQPMLSFAGLNEGKVEFRSHLKKRFEFDLNDGETIYIPGAGIASLQDFQRMMSADGVNFILNDNNPFVSGTFERLAALNAADNIKVQEGGFENADLPDNSVGLMVLSLIHMAGRDNINTLAEKAANFMRKGGSVLAFNPNFVSNRNGDVDTNQLIRIFQKNGFNLKSSKPVKYTKLAALPDDSKDLLKKEAMEILKTQLQASDTQTKGSFVILKA